MSTTRIHRPRRGAGQPRLRGAAGGGRPRPRDWAMPADEWDAISLNYTSGTTGDPKGVVYHHRGAALLCLGNVITGHRAASGLSLDPADVPLQRLVLRLDALGGGGHPCLPASGPGGRPLRGPRRARGHASLRRADRHAAAAQRLRLRAPPPPPPRRLPTPPPRRPLRRCSPPWAGRASTSPISTDSP